MRNIITSLFNLPWYLAVILLVVLTATLAITFLLFIRRRYSKEFLQTNHDVAGFTLGILGILYSVFLGLSLISVQNRYNDVAATVHTEANALIGLYRDAAVFPDDVRVTMRETINCYVDEILSMKWVKLQLNESSQPFFDSAEKLWNTVYSYSPQTVKEEIWYRDAIEKLNTFAEARYTRLFHRNSLVSPMMWALLLSGAIATVAFLFFFGMEHLLAQIFLTSILAGYLAFMLYMTYSLDHVFTGNIHVKPYAMVEAKKLFIKLDQEQVSFPKYTERD